jgi:hypothetical protein
MISNSELATVATTESADQKQRIMAAELLAARRLLQWVTGQELGRPVRQGTLSEYGVRYFEWQDAQNAVGRYAVSASS